MKIESIEDLIVYPGDWVKLGDAGWYQVWEIKNSTHIAQDDYIEFRDGKVATLDQITEVLDNATFFEQKSFGVVG